MPILFSLGLIIIGELGSVETLIYKGIWGCLTAMAYLLYGRRIRFLIFPLIIYVDHKERKLRPALVIRQLPGAYAEWLICMISSRLSQKVPSLANN